MREFFPYLKNQDSLKATQTEFAATLKNQLALIYDMRQLAIKVQKYEMAAFYREMEKDFEDLQELINTKNK